MALRRADIAALCVTRSFSRMNPNICQYCGKLSKTQGIYIGGPKLLGGGQVSSLLRESLKRRSTPFVENCAYKGMLRLGNAPRDCPVNSAFISSRTRALMTWGKLSVTHKPYPLTLRSYYSQFVVYPITWVPLSADIILPISSQELGITRDNIHRQALLVFACSWSRCWESGFSPEILIIKSLLLASRSHR